MSNQHCRQSQDADRPATAAAAEVMAGLLAVPAVYAPGGLLIDPPTQAAGLAAVCKRCKGTSARLCWRGMHQAAARCDGWVALCVWACCLLPLRCRIRAQRLSLPLLALWGSIIQRATCVYCFFPSPGGAWSEWLAPALRQALAGAPLGERHVLLVPPPVQPVSSFPALSALSFFVSFLLVLASACGFPAG